jgi:hypothetical protein
MNTTQVTLLKNRWGVEKAFTHRGLLESWFEKGLFMYTK